MNIQFPNRALLFSLVIVAALAVTLTACKKKLEAPVVTVWDTHTDVIDGSEVQSPQGWLFMSDPRSKKIYSSQVVSTKFYEVYSAGSTEINEDEGGVEVEISSTPFKEAGVGTLDEYKKKVQEDFSPFNLSPEEPATVAKENGVAYSYKVKVGRDVSLHGRKIVVAHDSVFYIVSVSGFNEYYDVYKPILDKIVESIKLPRPKESYKDPNAASKPSPDLAKFSNDFVEFEHPANFEVTFPKAKSGMITTLHVEGLRKDCTIDLDVFPTKTDKGEVKFEKFVEDNKSKFKPKSTGSDKIDGITSVTITAAPPAKDIERKVYFLTKGEKIYQIVLTWYKPMGADFQPAFEKVVASLKLK
jgi:hypothetical protein